MITNEEFKNCVDICNKRTALMQISKELNDAINSPPPSNADLKKDFYYNNKSKSSYWSYAITTYVVITIPGFIIMFFNGTVETHFGVLLILSVVASTIMGIIGQCIYNKKLKHKCAFLIKENTKDIENYNNALPEAKEFSNKINNEIITCNDTLLQMNAIPKHYWDVAGELWYFITVHEADNYKEAVRIWEDIQHKIRIENLSRQQLKYQELATQYAKESRDASLEAMRAAMRSEEYSKANFILSAYSAYEISNLNKRY